MNRYTSQKFRSVTAIQKRNEKLMTVKCPCCRYEKLLESESRTRLNVQICETCFEKEQKSKTKIRFKIDEKKLDNVSKRYYELLIRHDIERNCGDETEADKLHNKIQKAKRNRLSMYVIIVESYDGAHAIGEFYHKNDALAKTIGWLGENYTTVKTDEIFVSQFGDLLSIIQR